MEEMLCLYNENNTVESLYGIPFQESDTHEDEKQILSFQIGNEFEIYTLHDFFMKLNYDELNSNNYYFGHIKL